MFRIAKWITPLVTLALLVCLNGRAQAEDAKGTISGTVKNADGTAAANATVRVMKAEMKADKPTDAKPQANEGKKPKKHDAIAETTTDDKGDFKVEVPPGDYTVGAMIKGVGNGREKVTVKAGETANVTINLKPMKNKEPKKEIKN
jgi:hypothetical protein